MFNDNVVYINVLDAFADAAGMITASGAMSIRDFANFTKDSAIIDSIVKGDLLYATSNSMILAILLCQEALGDGYSDLTYLSLIESYADSKRDLVAYWCAKTEMDVAIKKNESITEIRQKVSFDKLLELFDIYHVFLNTDVIINEQYDN